MKKVINPHAPSDTIHLSEALEAKYPLIGFKNRNGGKTTLIPTKYKSDLYFARRADDWEIGNGYDPYGVDQKSIQDWERFFRECHSNSEMFLFDSSQELFKWLAE